MKFQKKYTGSNSLKDLLSLYLYDLANPEFRTVTFEDISTGARAIAL